MNDDQLDEILSEAARDYNAPGDIPRDVMWARITEARRQRKVALPASNRVWLWSSAGIAAALLIATGISIGRRMERSSPIGGAAVASRGTLAGSCRSASRVERLGDPRTLS